MVIIKKLYIHWRQANIIYIYIYCIYSGTCVTERDCTVTVDTSK